MKRYTDILKALELLRFIKYHIENDTLILSNELDNLQHHIKGNNELMILHFNLVQALKHYRFDKTITVKVIDVKEAYRALVFKVQELLIISNESELNI